MKSTASVKENLSEEEKKVKMKHIQELFSKAKEYGDDKVQLAIQTYELVDKHIRRLDSDLARFEGEIHDKAMTTKEKTEENVGKSKNFSSKKIKNPRKFKNLNFSIIFQKTLNFPSSEGRKKTKDTKVAGKKKRAASEDEDKVEEKTAVQPKSNKKQKVIQEKDSARKAQKVIHPSSFSSIYFCFFLFYFWMDFSPFFIFINCSLVLVWV